MGHLNGACGPVGRSRRAGFTLVELLLTVALFLLLASVAVFNFGPLQRGAPLEEGAALMESLFRYTRAQAASSGRTLRVVFAEGTGAVATTTNFVASVPGSVQVLWESDPFGTPGQFVVLAEAAPFTERLNELVEVRTVRSATTSTRTSLSPAAGRKSSSLQATPDPTDLGSAPQWPPVVFYADGSSDSVEVWLGSRDAEDGRELGIVLSGVVGTTRRKWRTLESNGSIGEDFEAEEKENGDEPSQ